MALHDVFGLAAAVALLLLTSCKGFLNIEELTDSKYTLDILNKPMNELEIIPSEGLRLASRHGQNYYCKLPKETEKPTEKVEEKIPKTTPIATLLEPMRSEGCLKIAKGWWTYEFCYGKYVKQYHAEGEEQKGETTYLGYYQSDFDWNKETLDETPNFRRHKFNRYHSQSFVNGTSCDVIKHSRDTEIRYLCEDSSTETYIERVDEPSTCSYILTIRTPYVCSHPHTKPLRSAKPIDIVCRPVLSTGDYVKFEEMERAQKARDEAFFRYAAAARKLSQRKQIFQAMKEKANAEDPMGLKKAMKDDGYGLNDMEQFFYSQMMSMFGSAKLKLQGNEREEEKQSVKKETEAAPASKERDLDEKRAIKMIERFIVEERLQNLKAFQQRRLVLDVTDLLRLYGHLPTADQARMIEKYVTRYVGTVEDMMQMETEAADFEQKTLDGLNSQLLNDIQNLPLPDSEEDDGEEDEDADTKKKDPVKRMSVHVKVHKVKKDLDTVQPGDFLEDEGEDLASIDPSWKKLEEDIGQGLEDAGIEMEDGHLEIRLITNADSIGESVRLSSEEGARFREMLLELVGGGAAQKIEVKKQKALHDNYNLVWEKGSSTFKSLGHFDEENNEKDPVKSPRFTL